MYPEFAEHFCKHLLINYNLRDETLSRKNHPPRFFHPPLTGRLSSSSSIQKQQNQNQHNQLLVMPMQRGVNQNNRENLCEGVEIIFVFSGNLFILIYFRKV